MFLNESKKIQFEINQSLFFIHQNAVSDDRMKEVS
jgi:hypothetical protein